MVAGKFLANPHRSSARDARNRGGIDSTRMDGMP